MFAQSLIRKALESATSALILSRFITVALITLLLSAPGHANEGSLYSRTFNLNGIKAIEVSQSYQVTLVQGSREYVKATGPQDMLSLIAAEFHRGRLNISSHTGTLLPVALEIGVQSLDRLTLESVSFANVDEFASESLKISRSGDGTLSLGNIRSNSLKIISQGSGQITGDSLVSENLSLTISGTGHINIHAIQANHLRSSISGSAGVHIDKVGEVETSAIQLSGSGLFDAANVIIHEAEIAIAGSANALVNVLENLDVNTSGSGTVTYYGNPDINTGIFGTGLVRRAF